MRMDFHIVVLAKYINCGPNMVDELTKAELRSINIHEQL